MGYDFPVLTAVGHKYLITLFARIMGKVSFAGEDVPPLMKDKFKLAEIETSFTLG
jgi:hypothetical protein